MTEPDLPVVPGDEDEDKRRRRAILWLLLGGVLLLLLLVFFIVLSGGGDDVAAPATSTTTTVPVTAAPTTAATTSSTTTQPSTTTTEAGPIDVSGVWFFLIDVTKAAGICSGEEDERVEPNEVTIRQDGVTLSVTGLNNTDPPWPGEIVGNSVTFGGERDEDRGRTTAAFTLTVDDAATTMSGIEVWDWNGPGGGCTDSLSDVTASRG